MWDFANITTPVARKRHRCDDCQGIIEPGEKYMRCDGKYDGEMSCFKDHLDCRAAALRIMEVQNLAFDEVPVLHDLDPEDYPIIRAEFPAVAVRLGIDGPAEATATQPQERPPCFTTF